jgi:hypothetical protein
MRNFGVGLERSTDLPQVVAAHRLNEPDDAGVHQIFHGHVLRQPLVNAACAM